MNKALPHPFKSIEYLAGGNSRQQKVYSLLKRHRIMEKLAPFTPVLTGTFPLEIDTPTSDVDIICCFDDPKHFESTLVETLSFAPGFHISRKLVRSHDSVLLNMTLDDLPIEVFGQAQPTGAQDSFRHMLVEYEILNLLGNDFRQRIIGLKEQGYKTEPAFAFLLGIVGDPFDELLKSEVVDSAVTSYLAGTSSNS